MPTSTACGGAAKKRTVKKTKKATKKAAPKKAPKKTAGPSLDQVKKTARSLGIPLSKDGKCKTKAQLKASIAYKKH